MRPTEEQLRKIHSIASAALPLVEPESVAVHKFIAADNLIARSKRAWSSQAVETIARMLPGRPFMADHSWGLISAIQGVVIDSQVLSTPHIPRQFLDNHKNNNEIFAKEGYKAAIATIAIPSASPLNSGLQIGAINTVSIGGFRPTDLLNPENGASFFAEANKGKRRPPLNGWADDEKTTAYAIWPDTSDMGELSAVVIPDNPRAQLITQELKDLFQLI